MRIASVNVNGLDNKKNAAINLINQNNLDIICLQETHKISTENFNLIEKETNTFGFISTPTGPLRDYRGVAILIGRKLQQYQIQNITIDIPTLRYRVMHISILAEEKIHIVNVYAPVANILPLVNSKLAFYKDLQKYITKFKNEPTILLGDFNYVEHEKDRSRGLNYYDKKILGIFNSLNLNLIDTYNSINNQANFTHSSSRIDRMYISQIYYPKILKIQHQNSIFDHKLVLLEINLDKFKPWGRYYWKLNNTLLTNAHHKSEITTLITEYNETKILNKPHENWENFKKKVQKISQNIGSTLAARRKKELEICTTLKNQNLPNEILESIKEKEKEIKNIQTLGNLIRVKNNTLNKIYSEGKQIDRKEEFHKGISKFIFKIKSNNIEYTEKQDILDEIQKIYQDLYTSQNIPDNNIIKYLENFNPPTLNEDQKKKR